MSRIDGLKGHLQALEARLIDLSCSWPPAEGSFSHYLWQALGSPEERHSYLDMYMQASQKFYEGEHEPI